jgi:hypothetical protein
MNWIKSHKIIVLLLIVIGCFLLRDNFNIPSFRTLNSSGSYGYSTGYSAKSLSLNRPMEMPDIAQIPSTESLSVVSSGANRIVTQESNMSLLVKDVKESGDKILAFAKNSGGYMVYASYTRPTETPFASIAVRIPAEKLDQALIYFKSLAAKVTSENLVGADVTDQYTDIDARLATLKKTQVKFEEILNKAIDVQDILTVQRELINLQDQIDSYVGQQKAIEKNAELTKIDIYLSTDEIALPYTPDNVFRPSVVFKYAIRSLLNTLRVGAEALIWIAVYSPLIAVVILIYFLLRRWRQKRSKISN